MSTGWHMASVYQSKEYGLAEAEDEDIISVSPEYFASKTLLKLPLLGKKLILEARGMPSEADLESFKNLTISEKYFYGTIAPPVLKPNHELFKKYKFSKVSNHTILIDLKQDLDLLWNNLEKKSARWGVKFAIKNGLECLFAEESDLEDFYALYLKTAERGKFTPKSFEFIKKILDSSVSKTFLVKKGNELFAGGLLLIDKGHNYSILDITAVSDKGMEYQSMPFLYWNMIQYSKAKHLDFFNLGGYDAHAKKGDKLANVNKFKSRFGGTVMEQPIYSTNGKYPFLRRMLGSFGFMKRWYKK